MIDEGKILSRHEFKTEKSKLTIAAIIFTLASVLALIVTSITNSISSAPSVPSIFFVVISVISLSFIFYSRLNSNPAFTYFLYEKGVRVFNHYNGNVYFIPFNKILYIHKYHTGINPNGRINTMAFRTSKLQPWNIIINNISNAYPLINTIIHQQVMHVGVVSLNTLALGKNVVFELIRKNNSWLNLPIVNGILNIIKVSKIQMDTTPLTLSAHALMTLEGIIYIEDILRIEISREKRHDKIRLFDAEGNILFSLDYSALISADLFIALIEHMIQNRIPAYYG
ncbi:hypothetical protein [Yersinia sp. Marseille-Q3913]|uniref:hypothetical protein n=1 Tax=Yersinia sp. Marseille-Q3913 TaxID=2830769 RepID=UPI001BB05FF7|nr:hypothetical protein [Yersinia sp. Marseille-Q3913]MBS0057145.1 hypothetical protein [Yersinia sp. Marseille-Q3913]